MAGNGGRFGSALLSVFIALALCGCALRPQTPPAADAMMECPPWPDYPVDPTDNMGSPFLGCVTRANLKRMLVSPSEIQRGAELGNARGERESQAVERYLQGKAKGFGGEAAPTMAPTTSLPGSPTGASQ